MAQLPCTGQTALYDLVLFDDTTAGPARAEAQHRAAALCAACPAPCEQQVTVDTVPQTLVLLPSDWLPPAREGKPEPEQRTPRRRQRETLPPVGRDYVRPAQRVTAWARMAGEDAARGRSLADIALDLCVSEDTAAELIRIHSVQTRSAA